MCSKRQRYEPVRPRPSLRMKYRKSVLPCWFLLAVGLLGAALRSPAETVLPSPSFAPGSGIEMRITNFYEEIPPYGFLPLRVEVKNASSSARKWNFRTVHSQANLRNVQSINVLEVPASSQRTFDLLVPLVPQAASTSRYSDLSVTVTGYGVTDGTSSDHSSVGSKPPTAFTGMGDALATKNWGPLRELLDKKRSKSLDGSSLDPGLLPTDWRALAGFENLIFTSGEWRSIGAAEREAIQDWIMQGGRLILCHPETAAPADLLPAGSFGNGAIEHWVEDNGFVERVAKMLESPSEPPAKQALENYTWQWSLAKAVGRPEPPQILIVVFVIAFAVIIGPLNFVVLAPLGKRHRLFWTTPLISVTASLIMAAFIFLSEGLGGSGKRFEAELSLPAVHKTAIWQEQVSRTGVLLDNGFTPSERSIILPLELWDHAGSYRRNKDRGISYILNGANWSGDWFESRNTQAQFFAAVIPTRGKLEIQPGSDGKPVAISSFNKELKDFWYFDTAGEAWRGSSLKPGEKQPLKAANKDAHAAWLKKALQPAGPIIRSRVEKFGEGEKNGKFFAISAGTDPINSLPSIRWKDSSGIIFGQTIP